MNENEIRGKLVAHAFYDELEKISGAFDALGGFLRGQATRVAGKATETGVEQTAQRFARDEAGKVLKGTRTFKPTGLGEKGGSFGATARAAGATALDWAGRHPKTATGLAVGGTLAAGAAPGFVAGRMTS